MEKETTVYPSGSAEEASDMSDAGFAQKSGYLCTNFMMDRGPYQCLNADYHSSDEDREEGLHNEDFQVLI